MREPLLCESPLRLARLEGITELPPERGPSMAPLLMMLGAIIGVLLFSGCASTLPLMKPPPAPVTNIALTQQPTDPVRVIVSVLPGPNGFKVASLNVRALLSNGSYRAAKTDGNGEAILFLPQPMVESWIVAAPGERWVDVPGSLLPLVGEKDTYRARLYPGGK